MNYDSAQEWFTSRGHFAVSLENGDSFVWVTCESCGASLEETLESYVGKWVAEKPYLCIKCDPVAERSSGVVLSSMTYLNNKQRKTEEKPTVSKELMWAIIVITLFSLWSVWLIITMVR